MVPVRFSTGQLQLVEQDFAELLGRADVEGGAGLPVDLGRERPHLVFHVGGLAREHLGIDPHADAFEGRQDRHERQLEVAIEDGDAGSVELGCELLRQLPGEIRAFAGEVEQAIGRERREGLGLGALAAHVIGEPRPIAELFERQWLQFLARAGGVEQIGREHRVEVESGQRHSVARQDDHGELQIVAHLRHRGILEHGLENGERGVAVEPAVVHERHRAKRQEARTAAAGRAHEPRQRRAHAGLAIGESMHGDPSARADLVAQRPDTVQRLDHHVIGGDGFGRGRELRYEGAEAERGEEAVAALARRAPEAQRVGDELHRHGGIDGDEFAAQARVVAVGEQRFPLLLRLHLAGGGQQRVERSVGDDQIARALLADAWDPLHVVARVAHDGQHVDDLERRHAELLLHPVGVVPRPLVLGVVDANAAADQLEEVLVAGDDRHLKAGRVGLPRKGADDVVGFEALARQDRHAHRFARLVHPRNLLGQIRGHGRAVGLVVGGQLVAEGCRLQVERGGDVGRPVVGQQLAQHRDEAVDRVGRAPVWSGQPADRVIRAIHLIAAVDEEEGARFCHGARPVL